MTLSHCWGKSKFFVLTKDTYEELHLGIELKRLPLTFQHAVQIALRLGAKYLVSLELVINMFPFRLTRIVLIHMHFFHRPCLPWFSISTKIQLIKSTLQWIDSLCILQDSKEDWSKEAPLMAGVYRGSLCNIAASASASSKEGCFRSRDPMMVPPIVVTTSWSNYTTYGKRAFLIENLVDLRSQQESSQPLFSRGWVFQELQLAPRILHYSSEGILWSCKTTKCSEKYLNGYPSSSSDQFWDQVKSEEGMFSKWEAALHSYSRLSLTEPKDKLVAISGYAQHLHTLDPSAKYLAGLVRPPFLL